MLTVEIVSRHHRTTWIYEAESIEHDIEKGYFHLEGCRFAGIAYDPEKSVPDDQWYEIKISNREGKCIAEFMIPIPQGEDGGAG